MEQGDNRVLVLIIVIFLLILEWLIATQRFANLKLVFTLPNNAFVSEPSGPMGQIFQKAPPSGAGSTPPLDLSTLPDLTGIPSINDILGTLGNIFGF